MTVLIKPCPHSAWGHQGWFYSSATVNPLCGCLHDVLTQKPLDKSTDWLPALSQAARIQLSSSQTSTIDLLGVVIHVCNPSSQKTEGGRLPGDRGQNGYVMRLQSAGMQNGMSLKNIKFTGAGEMAPSVKCLLDKREDLSSDPPPQKKTHKKSIVRSQCWEDGGFLGLHVQ